MVDLGILDVLQIFGRAGRPQFDTSGHGTIITTHDKLSHYLALLTNQYPIESSFINHLSDNLNAEVCFPFLVLYILISSLKEAQKFPFSQDSIQCEKIRYWAYFIELNLIVNK